MYSRYNSDDIHMLKTVYLNCKNYNFQVQWVFSVTGLLTLCGCVHQTDVSSLIPASFMNLLILLLLYGSRWEPLSCQMLPPG